MQILLHCFLEYRMGILPEPGGRMDQPATFMDSMEILTMHAAEIEEEMKEEGRETGAS